MIASKIALRSLNRRAFSTVNPRITIVQSVLKLDAIRGATNEKALASAIEAKYDIDVNNLPESLAEYKEYLSTTPTSETYTPNPNYWHNKPFFQMIFEESKREETWSIIVGGM